LLNQYQETDEKNAFGTSIFWKSDQGSYDFTMGGTIQLEQVKIKGEDEMSDPRLVIGVSGAFAFGDNGQHRLHESQLSHVRNYLFYIHKNRGNADIEAEFTKKINRILMESPELKDQVLEMMKTKSYLKRK
jgi:hypothetical protein